MGAGRYPSYPKTATRPKVGERRWVRGEFEVEVLGFQYEYGANGQEERARVWLDPERCELDPDNPDVNQNTQVIDSLLTEAEAARQSIAVARWHHQEIEDARRSMQQSEDAFARVATRACNLTEKVKGKAFHAADPRNLTVLRLAEDALNDALVAQPRHCGGRSLHIPHDWSGVGDDLGWWHCGGVS